MSVKRGDENFILRHYPSTPHLDGALTRSSTIKPNNKSTILVNASSNGNLLHSSYMPKTTLSTFTSHKSGADVRYRDDPNPYKVSDIEEHRIKVHDPYVPKTLHRSTQGLNFYTADLDEDPSCPGRNEYEAPVGENEYYISQIHRSQTMKSSSNSHKSISTSISQRTGRSSCISGSVSNSSTGDGELEAECEIPEPDYDGSTVGSSEDLPLPIPESSCSEEYSSVSAGSDPGHYATLPETGTSPSPSDEPTTFVTTESGGDNELNENPTKLSDADKMKIEYALKGRKTTVFIANALANLYVMRKYTANPRSSTGAPDEGWVLKYTGVPVLLLDSGETKSRDKRRIQIVLAELGSGLALWKDVIDNLTSYKVMEGSLTFHTMHLSSDHTKIIGLSFDDEESAVLFSQKVEKLTSDFANISLSGSKSKSKGKKDKALSKSSKPVKYVRPKKSEISQPCCFHHVSSLNSNDRGRLSSLQNFISKTAPITVEENDSVSFNSSGGSMTIARQNSVSKSSLSIPRTSSANVTSSGSEISF